MLVNRRAGECGGGGVFAHTWWVPIGDVVKWYFFIVDGAGYHQFGMGDCISGAGALGWWAWIDIRRLWNGGWKRAIANKSVSSRMKFSISELMETIG